MLLNNPLSTVEVTTDKNICINGTGWNQCVPEGEPTRILKAHVRHCAEPRQLTPAYCPPTKRFVTIAAGETYQSEVETGTAMSAKITGPVAYTFGTAVKPIVIPESLTEIKENAPVLLEAGTHSLSLADVTEFAFINCSAVDVKAEITIEGC